MKINQILKQILQPCTKKPLAKLAIMLFLAAGIFYSTFAFAETIIFKWGQKIEEKIIEKTDKQIKIIFQGTPLAYRLEDIESIDGVKQVSSSKEASIEASFENAISKKEPESQESLTASTENELNSSYSNFDVFRIKIPKGWIISQKKDSMVTRVAFSKKPYDTVNYNAVNFHGFMILYTAYPTPLEPEAYKKFSKKLTIKKLEESLRKNLEKYGFKKYDNIINSRSREIKFNNIPALQFDADIPQIDSKTSLIIFYKNGLAFSIVITTSLAQYNQDRPIINDSLSSFELTRTESDFLQQQAKKTERIKLLGTIIAFLCAPLCYYLAKRKNITWPIMWAIFGLLLSIIPVIILLIISKRKIGTV